MTEREIFLAVLDLPDPTARARYLDGACGGDPARRARIESLLSSHDSAGSFLGSPVVDPPESDNGVAQELRGVANPEDENDADGALDFLQPSTRPDSLGRIGHYEVLQVLGKGGFGIVFRAFDEVLQRVVAVKVLAPHMAATSPARKRFLREARSSAKVRQENVVQVYAVEEHPLPYLVMEFIPGETLQQRLDRTGPLEAVEVVQFGRQIAEGLAAAHAQGLIHRDIKPANILIEAGPQPCVKITDFGLARAADDASLTQSRTIAGTPMYMAPEQAHGETLDHRADLFSLGSVLYTMCSGRPPFRADNTLAVLKRVAEDTPRPIPEIIPEVPQWLCDIIARLHAKKPEDRIGTAREVADLLGSGLAAMDRPGGVPTFPEVAQSAVLEMLPVGKIPGSTTALKPHSRTPRWAGEYERATSPHVEREESECSTVADGGSMSDELRYQPSCYYASTAYSESFWGKFIYIYQGKGSLRLTTNSLCLEGCPRAVAIPFQAIKSIRLGRFSSWAKPFGLSRLTVRYTQEGEPRAIHLVPHVSAFDPTTVTSELVASWHETLGRVEELTDRVQSPQFEPEPSPPFVTGFLLTVCLIAPVVLGLIVWFVRYL